VARAREGDLEGMQRAQRYDPSAMAPLDGIGKAISQHASMIAMVYKNPAMSASDKRQLIHTLYFRMIELAQAGNKALEATASQ
jgi:hypothetical protein